MATAMATTTRCMHSCPKAFMANLHPGDVSPMSATSEDPQREYDRLNRSNDPRTSAMLEPMIRHLHEDDFEEVYAIVNDAAAAYRGVIPADRWADPYMPRDELREEIAAGVVFWGYEEDGALAGVMGVQPVQDVTLIRHAYVRTTSVAERRGVRSTSLRRSSPNT